MNADQADSGGHAIVHAGFIPLTDCAALVIAKERGFDRDAGISLRLHREVSWANIRDKLELGLFDCAHMLAPMALASSLGLGRPPVAVIAPMALNLNGNAITVSLPLYAEMLAVDKENAEAGGMRAAFALAAAVKARQLAGAAPLTLGMVYPFSCHNYDLRAWLAHAGIDPDNHVKLVVVPPPLIAESLAQGHIDGFCVGAPWGSVAVAEGQGRIIATKNELWSNSPEKVLGVRHEWAEKNPATLISLIGALLKAAEWLDEPANVVEAAEILSRADYIGVAPPILVRVLTGAISRQKDEAVSQDPDYIVFHRYAANFPWVSHAMWILTQMERWGQIARLPNLQAVARRVYRPDIYRRAAATCAMPAPIADMKTEGQSPEPYTVPADGGSLLLGASRMFAGEIFDPFQIRYAPSSLADDISAN